MAQNSKGNTVLSRRRVRNWCFTLNNYTEGDIEMLKSLKDCKIMFGKEEAPTTGTPHLQGFIMFKNPRTLVGLKRINPLIHWEEMKGDINANIIYCSKESKEEDIYSNIDDWQKVAQGTRTLNNGCRERLTKEEILKKVFENMKNDIEESINNNNINWDEIIPMPILFREDNICYNSDEEFEKDIKY